MDIQEIKDRVISETKTGMEKVSAFITPKKEKAEEIIKLKRQISICKEVLAKNYTNLGKYYYRKNGTNPDPEAEKMCSAIRNAENGIASLEEQLAKLK